MFGLPRDSFFMAYTILGLSLYVLGHDIMGISLESRGGCGHEQTVRMDGGDANVISLFMHFWAPGTLPVPTSRRPSYSPSIYGYLLDSSFCGIKKEETTTKKGRKWGGVR